MRRHLKEIHTSTSDRCYIVGEKVCRNHIPYTVEDILENEETRENRIFQKAVSESQTSSRIDYLARDRICEKFIRKITPEERREEQKQRLTE